MPRSLVAYRNVGYPYMLMPDHVPQIDGRDPSGVAFADCDGYIQGLLDALALRSGPTTTRHSTTSGGERSPLVACVGRGRPRKGHD
jgi:hypothetical protein